MPAILEELATSANLHRAAPRPVEWARRLRRLAPLLLLMAGFAAYAPALRNGFVWDDHALVEHDPLIRSWRLIGEGFQHYLFVDAAASNFYRPLQRLSYTFDYLVFFVSPAGYHFVSIFWHVLAGTALFYFAEEFLRRCGIGRGRRVAIAFFAALGWLIHPAQSAAVAYVAGRADPLAVSFGFFGLYLALRTQRARPNRRLLLGFATGLCFLASALSKEMGLLFPMLWLVIVVRQGERKTWLGATAVLVSVLIAYGGLRIGAERIPPPPQPVEPALVRPVIMARAVAEYAGLILFPLRLHMERDVATHPSGFTTASINQASWRELQTLLGLMLVVVWFYALWRAHKRPVIFLPLLLALICYLPVSDLVPLNATVAEHWLYLPGAFLSLSAAMFVFSLGSRALFVGLTIWMLLLPVRTFRRTFDWKDQRTLITHTIRDGGDSARMLVNLGSLELGENHLAAAQTALEHALAKEPNNPLAQLNLAAVKMRMNDFVGARALLIKVSDPPELQARAEESLFVLESRQTGKVNLLRLRRAARLGAINWTIERRYVAALASTGSPERAVAELRTCLSAAPYRSEGWLMMSELLRGMDKPDEAAIALAQAEAMDVHLRDRFAPR